MKNYLKNKILTTLYKQQAHLFLAPILIIVLFVYHTHYAAKILGVIICAIILLKLFIKTKAFQKIEKDLPVLAMIFRGTINIVDLGLFAANMTVAAVMAVCSGATKLVESIYKKFDDKPNDKSKELNEEIYREQAKPKSLAETIATALQNGLKSIANLLFTPENKLEATLQQSTLVQQTIANVATLSEKSSPSISINAMSSTIAKPDIKDIPQTAAPLQPTIQKSQAINATAPSISVVAQKLQAINLNNLNTALSFTPQTYSLSQHTPTLGSNLFKLLHSLSEKIEKFIQDIDKLSSASVSTHDTHANTCNHVKNRISLDINQNDRSSGKDGSLR